MRFKYTIEMYKIEVVIMMNDKYLMGLNHPLMGASDRSIVLKQGYFSI